jgi:hypothetical protein
LKNHESCAIKASERSNVRTRIRMSTAFEPELEAIDIIAKRPRLDEMDWKTKRENQKPTPLLLSLAFGREIHAS